MTTRSPVLDTAYFGMALRLADDAKYPNIYRGLREEPIKGAFRVAARHVNGYCIIGNGEVPETLWMVKL